MRYLLNILIAIDQLLNTVFCAGEADKTMSSNCYRMHRSGKPWGFLMPVIDFLFRPIHDKHCWRAYRAEQLRQQLPPEFRKRANG